ncbi:MAG: hypothetical protein JTT11_08040 [Candidatus Brockarchaeota archaeon]|nr:hypothetical protein [Candidatus Brockarchaeota archaeon]
MVGYDEDDGTVFFMDPWDRDLGKVANPDGTTTWSIADFLDSWNYEGYGSPGPYWGAIMLPWSIELFVAGKRAAGSAIKVTAIITYPCPEPFDRSNYPASDAYAEILLPADMSVKGPSRINLGTVLAGDSVKVSWNVLLSKGAANSIISVVAGGFVSGNVPEEGWKGGVCYPPYEYVDEIGGEASVTL